MSDSFFTAQNRFDHQLIRQELDAAICEEVLEAAARGMVRGSDALKAAERIQRVADICAGHQVMPIEHWRTPTAEEPAAPAVLPPSHLQRVWGIARDNPACVFWAGVIFGLFWEALWR
ncbi:hypothetical protein [Neoaquamicrobium sediminum]|uniref:hypothetical protein n=1 Tax=Neoaquamicrobium sediminum TaxID=1849104 RepID=UPI003BACF2B9